MLTQAHGSTLVGTGDGRHCRSEGPNCSLDMYMAVTLPEMIGISLLRWCGLLVLVGKIQLCARLKQYLGGRSWSAADRTMIFWS